MSASVIRRRPRASALIVATASIALVASAAVSAPQPAAASPLDYLNTPTAGPGSFTSVNLAADRTSENFFYRIPALAHLGDGVVLASWDARPGSAADAPNPNSIMERRSTDNGRTWGPPVITAAGKQADESGPRFGYSDPSYVVDRETGTVFNFFVYSKDQGFFGSQYGNDDDNRQVISSAVISSTDGGLTWSEPRLITDVTKPANGTVNAQGAYQPVAGDVRTNFATSGEGIQLRYGPYAGRLIQQYAGRVLQADGSTPIQAYSVYSDDHGATWQMGTPVGTGMDENKVVELSDGTVMLNSRDSDNGRQRKVTLSTDGGASYGAVVRDAELPDPTNNASIIRMHPDAAQGSADAQKLLVTNSNNGANGNRVNGAVRVSCDDGATWPGLRTLEPGFFAYSSATVLDDGLFGVLWERNYTDNMQFSTFDEAWINYACAPRSAPQVSATAGAPVTIPVTITNQEQAPLGGTLHLRTAGGWVAEPVAVPAIASGESAVVELVVTAPSSAQGTQRLELAFVAGDGRTSHGSTTVQLPITSAGMTITSALTSPARNVVTSPYVAGEQLAYSLRVTSTSGFPTLVTPVSSTATSGFAPTACRWNNLPALGAYNCTTPRVTLTQADIDRGWFVPEFTMTIAPMSNTAATTTVRHVGTPVALRDGALDVSIVGAPGDAARDVVADPYAVGNAVPYRFSVENRTPLTTSVVPVSGDFAPFLPPGPANCRFLSLAGLAGYDCTTPRHTVTDAEWADGFFVPASTWQLSGAGQSTRTLEVVGDEVDLRDRTIAVDARTTLSWIDTDSDGWVSEGDEIEVVHSVRNDSLVRVTEIRIDGEDVGALAAGESARVTSSSTVTAAEAVTGLIERPAVKVTVRNGGRSAEVTTAVDVLDLSGDVVPTWAAEARYERGDVVQVDGARFIATRPSTGAEPVDTVSAWRPAGSAEGPGASWSVRRVN